MLNPGFHSAAFLAHLSSGIDAIRIANLHFSLLCDLIQQWIFAILICSIAAAVLLFKYSIHSSSDSAASISSSVSFMKSCRCPGRNLNLIDFHSFLPRLSFLLAFPLPSLFFSLFFSLLTCVFLLCFLFVWIMRRSILRCVYCIIFSCSYESVHVLEAWFIVGVITMLNRRSLCCRRYDFEVNSCLYLLNDAQAALIRFMTSIVSCG